MNKALLVIDVQEVNLGENHHRIFDYDRELVCRINGIIDENAGNLTVYVYNYTPKNFINKFSPVKCYENTPEAAPAKALKIVSEYSFGKYAGNALTNPELDKLLREKEIDTVEIVGVDGGACVPLTALGALERGYTVIVNEEGIGTFKYYAGRKKKFDEKLKHLGAEYK